MAPKLPVEHPLLEGAMGQPCPALAPTKKGFGVQMSPIPPAFPLSQSGEGRCRHGLHTVKLSAFGEVRQDTAVTPSPGKTEAQRGHLLTRGLCLAELRQGPALSTRLKAEEDSEPCLHA